MNKGRTAMLELLAFMYVINITIVIGSIISSGPDSLASKQLVRRAIFRLLVLPYSIFLIIKHFYIKYKELPDKITVVK